MDRSTSVAPIDLMSIFSAAQQLRNQREQMAMQRQTHLDALSQQRFAREMQKSSYDLEQRKLQDAEAEAQRKRTEVDNTRVANVRRYAAQFLEANPGRFQDIALMLQRENAAKDIELPQAGATPDDIARFTASLHGASAGTLGAPPPGAKNDEIATQIIMSQGLHPGTPEFQAAYTRALRHAEEFQLRKAKAGSSQINVGGKDLPVTAVQDLADASSMIGAAGDLFNDFSKMVPSDGMVDQLKARGSAELPNTDVDIYNKKADAVAQAVGTFLEGGKLGDADWNLKYKNMVPRPGDSVKTAQAKTESIRKIISSRTNERSKNLSSVGYRVPEQGGPKKSPPVATDIESVTSKIQAAMDRGMSPEQAARAAGMNDQQVKAFLERIGGK